MRTFLTADHHFGHRNLLRFQDKDGMYFRGDRFSSVEEMDAEMVRLWNETVGTQDKVYHLGDVVMGDRVRDFEILRQLNGRKVLIKGNHDRAKLKVYAEHFKDVRATHLLETGSWPCTHLVLSHVPLNQFSLKRGWTNIHGHTHSNGSPKGPYVSVCVEKHDYRPVEFNRVVELAHEAIKKYGVIHDGGNLERSPSAPLNVSITPPTPNEGATPDEPFNGTGTS